MDSSDDEDGSWQSEDHDPSSDTEDTDEVGEHTDSIRGPITGLKWFMRTDKEWVAFVREVISSLATVAVIGLVLFAVSGLWPPMVAIESASMSPNIQTGDLVFVTEEHRFASGAAHNGTGIAPYDKSATTGYKKFNKFGDVIVYERNGNAQLTPVIHRARFWVSSGENWYEEANPNYLSGAGDCEELSNCPAEHAGFITKGDNNPSYDQVGANPISEPVKPSWITGTAEFRIPWLGGIRLLFSMLTSIPL